MLTKLRHIASFTVNVGAFLKKKNKTAFLTCFPYTYSTSGNKNLTSL